MVNIRPQFDQTTGELQKLTFSINGIMPGTWFKEDGVEVASTTETDSEGRKILKVKLKHTTDFTNGAIDLPRATNHTFSLTATQLASAGWDSETTIQMEQYVGTNPLNHVENNGCTVSCHCRYLGSTLCCVCYIYCTGKPADMQHMHIQ